MDVINPSALEALKALDLIVHQPGNILIAEGVVLSIRMAHLCNISVIHLRDIKVVFDIFG